MKRFPTIAITVFLTLAFAASAFAADKLTPARATWNTGFFQELLVRKGLEELGYKVDKPKDLANPLFYQAVTQGDVDYWCNGWFPLHNAQLPKSFDEKAEKVGFIAKAGGAQGYLISKKAAEEFGIKTVEDFKRPEVKKAFDANGDGKADLVACPPGWGCEKVITHHFEAYDLGDHINAIKAAYAASMADAMARFKAGDPIIFYTWAPNWTLVKLQPGKDVVWIGVPENKPTEGQKDFVDAMTLTGVEGTVTDPIQMGFVANDIRVVANKEFLAKNPAAAKFLELFELPVMDISVQNTKMEEGEKSAKDIERHADEWIAAHKATWDAWIAEAKKAQ